MKPEKQKTWTLQRVVYVLAMAAIIGLSVYAFFFLRSKIHDDRLNRFDRSAYTFFVLELRRPWLTPIMEGFSALASPVVLAAMLLAVAAFAPGRRPGWCAAANLVLVVILNTLLKEFVQRPRPDGYRLISEVGYSFPSGHSMVAVAFYGFLAWLVWRYETNQVERIAYPLVFGGLTLMTGLSRVYLGVHYATDVLAGFFVSLGWLVIFIHFIAPLFLPEEPPQQHEQEA